MNSLELIALFSASGILFLYLSYCLRSLSQTLIVTVLSLIPLYLSLEMATQFLIIDTVGTDMILEPALTFVPDISLVNWDHFALRTTDLFIGSIFYFILKFTDILVNISFPFLKMLTKALHWFIGFVIIIFIHNLLIRHFVSDKNKTYFSVLFIYSSLLLPTNILALKVSNYDLFSMLLAVYAIIHLFSAIKNKRYHLILISVIISVFAAQEKLIASPVFLLTSIFFCFFNSIHSKRRQLTALLLSIFVIGLGLFIGLLGFFIIGIFRNGNFLKMDLSSISFPLLAWWWPIVRLFARGDSHLPILASPLLFIILTTFFIFFSVLVLFRLDKIAAKKLVGLKTFNIILCACLFLVGVPATYFVRAYWAPYLPIKTGFYYPHVSFNNTIWHFGAANGFMHILNFIAYSISVFLNAIPSAYWISLLFIVFFLTKNKKEESGSLFIGWEFALLLSLLMPIGVGIVQAPVVNRFFNIAIFVFTIVILIKFENILHYLNSRKQAAKKIILLGGFMLISTLEILPYKPLFAPFRPFWSNYSQEYNRRPEVGRVNGSWLGWGEEIMLAGKKIEQICKVENIEYSKVRIYYNYIGEWINSKIPHISQISDNSGYSQFDYYILNRIAVVQNYSKFPYSVNPLFTISFKGFVQAWIFRGDQLKNAKFKF